MDPSKASCNLGTVKNLIKIPQRKRTFGCLVKMQIYNLLNWKLHEAVYSSQHHDELELLLEVGPLYACPPFTYDVPNP